MSPQHAALILIAGFGAGLLNTAGGGGGVLSFVALLQVGASPLVATATNLVAVPASFVGTLLSSRTQQSAVRTHRSDWLALVAAGVGTAIGVYLLTQVPPAWFNAVAPWLLLLAGVLLFAQPEIRRLLPDSTGERSRLTIAVTLFVAGVYAGFSVGGIGTVVLVILAYTTGWSLAESNRAKNVILLVMAFVAMGAVVFSGLVEWLMAAWLAPGLFAGGLVGMWLAGRVPDRILRGIVLATSGAGVARMLIA